MAKDFFDGIGDKAGDYFKKKQPDHIRRELDAEKRGDPVPESERTPKAQHYGPPKRKPIRKPVGGPMPSSDDALRSKLNGKGWQEDPENPGKFDPDLGKKSEEPLGEGPYNPDWKNDPEDRANKPLSPDLAVYKKIKEKELSEGPGEWVKRPELKEGEEDPYKDDTYLKIVEGLAKAMDEKILGSDASDDFVSRLADKFQRTEKEVWDDLGDYSDRRGEENLSEKSKEDSPEFQKLAEEIEGDDVDDEKRAYGKRGAPDDMKGDYKTPRGYSK